MSSLSAAAIKMASSSTNASTASSEQTSSAVQPSAALISALHHKLCDPSIVPEFEQCRSPHVTQRLITPRWVLLNSNNADKVDVADGADDCDGKDGSAQNHLHTNGQTTTNNNNDEHKFNTVPKRNYLDIRIEQNTIFANEQCLRCQKKLAALSSTSPKSVEAINVNKKQIQKVIDSIQNHLNEGLAACPNHHGLLQEVEPELKLWLDRINGVVVVNNDGSKSESPSAMLVDTAIATMSEGRGVNNNTIDIPKTNTQQQTTTVKRKGAEGRARAAMDDALVEKMFLQGDEKNNGHSNNNTDAVVDTNNLEDFNWIPPAIAPRVNDDDDDERRSAQNYRRREYPSDDYSDNSDHGRKRSSSSSRHNQRRIRHHRSKSRSRSKSAERGGEDRRRRRSKKRRRHRDRRRDDDDRKHRKKRRHRSRSRSKSRGSCSSSSASRSPISSRDRSKRRKHHRKDRHHSSSSHKRRHKSRRGSSSRRKERKSSKRHRSRRDRSRSDVSSSPSFSAVGPDDDGGGGVEGRFEPPLSPPVQHKTEELSVQREDSIEKRFVPPSNNKASDEK